ncbi:MAG: hypothetical protein A4E65_00743 [Syntrophorhabdus sp. PtaU1.Bin153]|nr:MAG: hypothetical protein A4E65_00743 [Syntrophorhabdus sp. PtaU1.Bin153]
MIRVPCVFRVKGDKKQIDPVQIVKYLWRLLYPRNFPAQVGIESVQEYRGAQKGFDVFRLTINHFVNKIVGGCMVDSVQGFGKAARILLTMKRQANKLQTTDPAIAIGAQSTQLLHRQCKGHYLRQEAHSFRLREHELLTRDLSHLVTYPQLRQ